MGIDIRWISIDAANGRAQIPDGFIEREVNSASAFYLRIPAFLQGSADYLSLITNRMAEGVPLLVMLDRNYHGHTAAFLQQFGIEGTDIGLFAEPTSPDATHARDIRVSRDNCPSAFRHPELFNGVSELGLDITHAIRLHGAAQSLLALPAGHGLCIDMKKDLPGEWPAPEFTCLAGYFGRGKDQTTVIAAGTWLLRDPFTNGFRQSNLGIQAGDNRIFAQNLLDFMVGRDIRPANTSIQAAYRRLEQIERNYFDFTGAVLSQISDDWWMEVPEDIRTACRMKREMEKNPQFGDSAYLDVLDYRAIWKAHWDRFQPLLSQAGLIGGKAKALRYFHHLNDIRKSVMHPTKTHSAGVELTREQADFLDQEVKRAIELWCQIENIKLVDTGSSGHVPST